jgi:hypothetical protein
VDGYMFFRKIINSGLLSSLVDLPDELQNTDVELLILPMNQTNFSSKKDFNPKEFTGSLKVEDPLAEAKILRDEWNRI